MGREIKRELGERYRENGDEGYRENWERDIERVIFHAYSFQF